MGKKPVEKKVKPLLVSSSRTSRPSRGLVVGTSIAIVVLVGLIGVFSNQTGESESVITLTDRTPPGTVHTNDVGWPGLTENIPEGVESGVLTMPLRTARWVHLTSDNYRLPRLGELNITAEDGFSISDDQFSYWRSSDGIEWRRDGEPPEEVVPLVDGSGGLLWSFNEDPLEVWTFDNYYGNWSEVDLSGLVPPESDGFHWNLDVSRPLTRERPETTQSVIHVGFTGSRGQVDQRLLVLEGNNTEDIASYVEVPWDVHSSVTLFGTSETFFAYVQDSNSNEVSVWRTDDGYTWTDFGLLHTQLGVRSSLNFEFNVLPALASPSSPTPIRNQMVVATTPDTGWESTNGIVWHPLPEDLPDGTHPTRLESGWFATDGDLWWMHAGGSWVSLADLGVESIGDVCQIVPRASGQTTLFFRRTCTSQAFPKDLWIISLDS